MDQAKSRDGERESNHGKRHTAFNINIMVHPTKFRDLREGVVRLTLKPPLRDKLSKRKAYTRGGGGETEKDGMKNP